MGRFLACFVRCSFSDSLVFRAFAILLFSLSLFCAAGVPAQSCLVSSIEAGSTHLGSFCCWATSVEAGGQNPLGWVFSSIGWKAGEGRPLGRWPCRKASLTAGALVKWGLRSPEVLLSPADQTAARTGWDWTATATFRKHKKGLRTARPLVLKVWSVNSGVSINQKLVGNAEHCCTAQTNTTL